MRICVITGGTGGIGLHLCEGFQRAGYAVTALDVEQHKALPDGIGFIQTDLRQAEAVKEAGLGVDADPTEAAEKLSKAMLKITVDGLTGKLTWNDKGQVQKEPTAYVITDGKYVQA